MAQDDNQSAPFLPSDCIFNEGSVSAALTLLHLNTLKHSLHLLSLPHSTVCGPFFFEKFSSILTVTLNMDSLLSQLTLMAGPVLSNPPPLEHGLLQYISKSFSIF